MRSYNHEFKQYAVKLIVDENKPMAEVARELDVPYGTLNKWAIKFRKHSCN
ncbi:MAG TPA: transposase [Candidatus Avamphibacillus sp.]|nr:transposase [Candidatus Avamphibacillus sp.]